MFSLSRFFLLCSPYIPVYSIYTLNRIAYYPPLQQATLKISDPEIDLPKNHKFTGMDFGRMGLEDLLLNGLHQAFDSYAAIDKSSCGGDAPFQNFFHDAKAMAATPADVKEYPNSYLFIIDMPGLKSGDVKVQFENDNFLTISGERKREAEEEGVKYVRMERRVGMFMRKFVLPENANPEKISAACQDGVLTVTVEKLQPPEPKKPRTIEVKIA